MAKWKKIVLAILIIAGYLNVGWAFGTYYYKNIETKTVDQLSVGQHIMAGWGDMWVCEPFYGAETNWSLSQEQMLQSILWPIPIFSALGSWVVAGVYYTLWFVFAGGAAKLLGLG